MIAGRQQLLDRYPRAPSAQEALKAKQAQYQKAIQAALERAYSGEDDEDNETAL